MKSYTFNTHPFVLLNQNIQHGQRSSDQTDIFLNISINPQIGIRLWMLWACYMLGTKQVLSKY